MFYFRKNCPGSNRTKRLHKKQQKYLDFIIDMACLYYATMRAPYDAWLDKEKEMMRKWKRQYKRYTQEMLRKYGQNGFQRF